MLVYCLQLQFLWNGAPLTAGRLPLYGLEVANVSYTAGHEPTETTLYRLDPEPIVYLADKGFSVWFGEPLSPAEGALEVRAALVPCTDPKLSGDARLGTSPALQAWKVVLRSQADHGEKSFQVAKPAAGTLSPQSSFAATLQLGKAKGDSEKFSLRLTSAANAATQVTLTWNRYPTPGRPPISFAPAHRPFDEPQLQLRPSRPPRPGRSSVPMQPVDPDAPLNPNAPIDPRAPAPPPPPPGIPDPDPTPRD